MLLYEYVNKILILIYNETHYPINTLIKSNDLFNINPNIISALNELEEGVIKKLNNKIKLVIDSNGNIYIFN